MIAKTNMLFKSLIIGMMLLIAHIGTPVAQAALEGDGSGLIAWYEFKDGSGTTVTDSSGYSHTGTIVGTANWTTGPTGTPYPRGGGLYFNGFSDYVRIPYYPTAMLEKRTIVVWLNSYSSIKAANPIFSLGRQAPGVKSCGDTNFTGFTSHGVVMAYSNVTGTNPITRETVGGLIEPNLGKWDHYAFVFDEGEDGLTVTRSIYRNGVLIGRKINSDGLSRYCGLFAIGTQEDYTNPCYVRTFHGKMGELRVYNRALSSGEITELYNRVPLPADRTLPTTPTGLKTNAFSYRQINLTWNANTDDTIGYVIYRGGAPIDTVWGASTNTYSDIQHRPYLKTFRYTVDPATSYSYTVEAFDAVGNYSTTSNTANATTPNKPPLRTYTLTVSKDSRSLGNIISSYGIDGTPYCISTRGIKCGSGCTSASYAYEENTQVNISPGLSNQYLSSFNGWSGGGCTGTGQCLVLMDGDKTVTGYYTGTPIKKVKRSH